MNSEELTIYLDQITEPTLSKSYLRLKANTVYKLGDFYKASELYSSFVDLYPEESAFLFATAKSYKMIGKPDLAADYSERLKLREPKNVNNLLLLTEIYLELNARYRASKMLDLAFLLDRENPKVIELKNRISGN
jgi:tetratricopeptide (TPR) repeat protein